MIILLNAHRLFVLNINLNGFDFTAKIGLIFEIPKEVAKKCQKIKKAKRKVNFQKKKVNKIIHNPN